MSMTLSGLSCGAKGNVSNAPCNFAEKLVVLQHHNLAYAMSSEVEDCAQVCGNCGRWHLGEDGDAPFPWLCLAKLA